LRGGKRTKEREGKEKKGRRKEEGYIGRTARGREDEGMKERQTGTRLCHHMWEVVGRAARGREDEKKEGRKERQTGTRTCHPSLES
jgi:hypothetical protein